MAKKLLLAVIGALAVLVAVSPLMAHSKPVPALVADDGKGGIGIGG